MNIITLPLPISIKQISLKLSLKTFWVLSIILTIAFLVFYIFQVNLMTTETYLIQYYQKKIKELSRENKTLEINFSQENSLSHLEVLVGNLNLEKADKIHYIQVLEGQVVAK